MKQKKKQEKKQQKNSGFKYQIIVIAVAIIMIMGVLIYAGADRTSKKGSETIATTSTETATPEASAAPAATAKPVELSDEAKSNVQKVKDYLLANGFQDEEGNYYTGYNYNEWLYCSILYDKESDILCLKNSYYTSDGEGDFYEMLAVWDNFPSSPVVLYCENHFDAAEDDNSQANAMGTLALVSSFEPETLTSESEINLIKSEESTYEAPDLEAVLEVAEPYTLTSFSYWDEIIEWTFDLNLKDFGLTNFERSGYASVSNE